MNSKFKPGDWLIVVGAAAMLIFGLALDWTTLDTPFGSGSGDNAFDYFFTGGLAWLLVVASGVIAALLVLDAIKSVTAPWSLLLVLATGLATVLMLIRLILGPRDLSGDLGDLEDLADIDTGRGAGMYVAFVAAAVALAGAVMNFTTSGGKFSDLTDIDKMRDAFKAGAGPGTGSTPSPPPPPSSPPPPPPSP